jgi:hypothetical protein
VGFDGKIRGRPEIEAFLIIFPLGKGIKTLPMARRVEGVNQFLYFFS